ncbi:MAG: leucine-rich repeat domain-containing protein [Candidatus Lokiarchaeota archaeon]|nr:leucine-rich repeat domain-containing protein [Candidatus Lokiarchaeota archaeon]
MANPSPEVVDSKLKGGEIDEKTAIALLISVMEESENEGDRVKSIHLLSQMNLKDDAHYRFIEGLVISDSSLRIQEYAAEILIDKFLTRGVETIRWLIKQKMSLSLVSRIFKALLKKAEGTLRELIIESFNSVFSGNIDFVKSQFRPHMEALVGDYRDYFNDAPFNEIPTDKLLEIFLGFETLVFIGDHYNTFYDLGHDLKDGYVISLFIGGSDFENWDCPSDIEGLENLRRLEELTLKMCGFREIGDLDYFPDLKTLDLSENSISEIENLENLVRLKYLSLAGNSIKEIKGLDNLKRLKSLIMWGNHVSEIKCLEELSNLQDLNLNENHIEEIKGLELLRHLKGLYLANNKIREIKGIEHLKELEILDLNGNKITHISSIENLINLVELDLGNNLIKKIEGMNGLKSLEKLWLNNNKIEVFRYLEKLPSIRNINIRNNRISQLCGLETIDSFVDIDLSNNHLSEPLFKIIEDLKKKKKINIDF